MIGSVTEALNQLAATEKRRTHKGDMASRDVRTGPDALTGAHDAAAGHRDALEAETAAKAFRDRGITDGPAQGRQPGPVEPGQFARGCLEAGHGARSPQAEEPRQSPMPSLPPGVPAPIVLPAAPMAAQVPSHVTTALSMGSPSDRAR